ncbi:MAG: siderophore-interacting protein [Actinocatenispora sp.]
MADEKRRGKRVTTLSVLRTEWLTPHLVRVVAGGPGLADFVGTGHTDQYVKIIFPRPGVEYPEPFDMETIRAALPREEWPVLRAYTVRYHRDDELAIDFVYHGEEGLAGPWAAGLKPGDEMRFVGPGGGYSPSPDADWHLLVGDEAALPAISAALEKIPAGRPAHVVIEVADGTEELPLTSTGDATIRWVHRTDGVSLADTVRSLDLPTGSVQAFVHGEAGMVRDLRRYLRFDLGVPRELLSVSGYWRHGMDDEGWRASKGAEREIEKADEAAHRD